MSAEIFEAADAAAWYATEHHRAAHDADTITEQSPAGPRTRWRRRTAAARLRRRSRLAGHLAAQARADHDQLLQALAHQIGDTNPDAAPLRTDPGAELLDRLYDALHAHHLAMREAARHNDEAAQAGWWQTTRRELALLRAAHAEDCMAAHRERIQQVQAAVDHHVRARLPR